MWGIEEVGVGVEVVDCGGGGIEEVGSFGKGNDEI